MIKTKRLLILLVGVLAAATMFGLGLWQASTVRTQGAEANRARAQQPPVDLPDQAQGDQVAALYGRQVTVTGEYLPDRWYFVGDKYPLRVVWAFKTSSGQVVPVVRGEVGPGKATPSTKKHTPPPPPTGTVRQTGLMMPSEKDPRYGIPGQDLPTRRLDTVKLETLAQQWPGPLTNGFVSLGASDATAQGLTPATVTLPEGEGSARNAGYALQWWVFGAFALVMTFVWLRATVKPAAVAGGPGPAPAGNRPTRRPR